MDVSEFCHSNQNWVVLHFVLCKFDFGLKVKFLFEAARERRYRKSRKVISRAVAIMKRKNETLRKDLQVMQCKMWQLQKKQGGSAKHDQRRPSLETPDLSPTRNADVLY